MLPARDRASAPWLTLSALFACTSDATLTPGQNDFAAADEVIDAATFDGDCGDFMPVDEVGARWTWTNVQTGRDPEDWEIETTNASVNGLPAIAWDMVLWRDAARTRWDLDTLYLSCDAGDVYLLGGKSRENERDCGDPHLAGAHSYSPPYRFWSTSGFESGRGWNTRTTATFVTQVLEGGCTGEVVYEESYELYFPIYYTVAEADTIELPASGTVEATRVHAQDLRHDSLYYSDLWVTPGMPIIQGASVVGLPWGALPPGFYLASYQPAE